MNLFLHWSHYIAIFHSHVLESLKTYTSIMTNINKPIEQEEAGTMKGEGNCSVMLKCNVFFL